MDKEDFINEVEERLRQMFLASKEGYKISPTERHRLEGFMQAGIFMKVATNSDLGRLMNNVHVDIFGKTIQQRKAELPGNWQEEIIDYSHYEQPTYVRKD